MHRGRPAGGGDAPVVQEVHDGVSIRAAHAARVQAVLRAERIGPRGQCLHRADVPNIRHEQGQFSTPLNIST